MAETDHLKDAREALEAADWPAARVAFEAALEEEISAEALDGLGLALWWLRRASDALQVRARAYTGYRRSRRLAEAASVATWLAREHRDLYGDNALADGWLRRAETCLEGVDGASGHGWIRLVRAEGLSGGREAIRLATEAVSIARAWSDPDLELAGLARLGVLEVAIGEVDEGLGHLDEAMAAATAGEARDPRNFGDACCALMEATDLLGDTDRVGKWGGAVNDYLASYDYAPLAAYGSPSGSRDLSAFCGACCGGIYLVTGRVDEAEEELLKAIAELEASGMRSRCVHPATQLAELRVVQGRLEEARTLLQSFEHLPEAVRPLAALELAEGSADVASMRLRVRVDQLSEQLVAAFPLCALLVEAEIARSDLAGAEWAVERLADVVSTTKSGRHEAELWFARGKVAVARGDADAPALFRDAARRFGEASLPLLACRARMALAGALMASERATAISEARAALAAFDRMGATLDADVAAAFLRDVGVRGRTGPKDIGLLSKREMEVLRLVAEGLSNQEISDRLFISIKTAGHHVSSILTKLGLRSRTEAAAYAALNLERQPAAK